jgi:protein-S-isoprenylcysteine O-methyltransferase Ste14
MWTAEGGCPYAILGIRMKSFFNTLLFTIVVPGTIAGWLPYRLHGSSPPTHNPAVLLIAIFLIVIGTLIYLHTAFWGFALHGRGTPAPIAPTKKLVVDGLHRYVRNPMYIGVSTVVLGQAVLFRSWHILEYLAVVLVIVHFFVLFYEEPTLARQFGAEYEQYKKGVPRWIPRLRKI